jgi:hypothetical protein
MCSMPKLVNYFNQAVHINLEYGIPYWGDMSLQREVQNLEVTDAW